MENKQAEENEEIEEMEWGTFPLRNLYISFLVFCELDSITMSWMIITHKTF